MQLNSALGVMGKIYRIPIDSYPSWIDPAYRSYITFFTFLTLIFTLALYLNDFSYSASTALVFLTTPMFIIFVCGLFLDDHPRTMATIIASIATLCCAGSAAALWYFYLEYGFNMEQPECDSPWRCTRAKEFWEHIQEVRASSIKFAIELAPLLLSTLLFGYTVYAQIRIIGSDDA